jgi:hypothetical protein
MVFRGLRNWPPVWIGLTDIETNNWRRLQGEIGVLKEVDISEQSPTGYF